MLKLFKRSIEQTVKVPNVSFFRGDVSKSVEAALELAKTTTGSSKDALNEMASFAKLAADPGKNSGWFVAMCETLFLGKGNDNSLKATNNFKGENKIRGRRVAQMFLPANIKNENLIDLGDQLQTALKGWTVIKLCGGVLSGFNEDGEKFNNENAAREIKKMLKADTKSSFLILSAGMGSRSFSVPQIEELYLAYDRGAAGSTIQKMSRTLTPSDDPNKVGKIISLSFDSNRDDKFDAMIVESAKNLVDKGVAPTLKKAAELVLNCMYVADFGDNGAVQLNVDDYLAGLQSTKGISRVFGKIADFSSMDDEMVTALANMDMEYFRAEAQDIIVHGKKTKESKKRAKKNNGATEEHKETMATAKELAKAREQVTAIIENLHFLMLDDDGEVITLEEGLVAIENDVELQDDMLRFFAGATVEMLRVLFEAGVINQEIAELMVEAKSL